MARTTASVLTVTAFMASNVDGFIFDNLTGHIFGRFREIMGDRVIGKMFLSRALDNEDGSLSAPVIDLLTKIDDPITAAFCKAGAEKYIAVSNEHWTTESITNNFNLGWSSANDVHNKNTKYAKSDGFLMFSADDEQTFDHHRVCNTFEIDLPSKDSFFGELETGDQFKNLLTLSIPITNSHVPITEELAQEVLTNTKFVPGLAYPETYLTDLNLMTDASFSRMFFYSLGAPLLHQQLQLDDSEWGPFKVDMPYHELGVRDEAYKRYGACVWFNKNQEVTRIHDYDTDIISTPDSDPREWAIAKMQARTTAFTALTVMEHLTTTHLQVANSLALNVPLHLSTGHYLRRLLNPHTFRTSEINRMAWGTLVPELSLLHRATPLTFESFEAVFDTAIAKSQAFEPFPQREINSALKALSEENKFPYYTQGIETWNGINKYVKNWIKQGKADSSFPEEHEEQNRAWYEAMRATSKGNQYVIPEYSEDNLIDLVTTSIWTVTAFHEIIGHVVDYTSGPEVAGARILRSDPLHVDAEAFINLMVITGGTSTPMPKLIGEYAHYYSQDNFPEYEKIVYNEFVEDMKILSKKFREEDEQRKQQGGFDVEFPYFDPLRFESSVSV